MTDLDAMHHHVRGEVARWSRMQNRPIGPLGILAKMELMESMIHHLLYDAGIKPAHDVAGETASPPGTNEKAPPPEEDSAVPTSPPPAPGNE